MLTLVITKFISTGDFDNSKTEFSSVNTLFSGHQEGRVNSIHETETSSVVPADPSTSLPSPGSVDEHETRHEDDVTEVDMPGAIGATVRAVDSTENVYSHSQYLSDQPGIGCARDQASVQQNQLVHMERDEPGSNNGVVKSDGCLEVDLMKVIFPAINYFSDTEHRMTIPISRI